VLLLRVWLVQLRLLAAGMLRLLGLLQLQRLLLLWQGLLLQHSAPI
jgi:hypothetical protein